MEMNLLAGAPASPRRRGGPWTVGDLVGALKKPEEKKTVGDDPWLSRRASRMRETVGGCTVPRVPGHCDICLTSHNHTWRVGPNGPQTLCNACGLKYSRELKKVQLTLKVKSP